VDGPLGQATVPDLIPEEYTGLGARQLHQPVGDCRVGCHATSLADAAGFAIPLAVSVDNSTTLRRLRRTSEASLAFSGALLGLPSLWLAPDPGVRGCFSPASWLGPKLGSGCLHTSRITRPTLAVGADWRAGRTSARQLESPWALVREPLERIGSCRRASSTVVRSMSTISIPASPLSAPTSLP